MKIVADENIPLLDAFFSDLGDVVTLPGRNMTAADVSDADILLVRSITRVNQALLAGSTVKFVGTCTIGTDHVDQAYLAEQGIGFSNAPGCNALAVVNYVLSALVTLGEQRGESWRKYSVGVVGAGNVGGRLVGVLEALGFNVVAYDPNVEEYSAAELAQAVWQQDVVTLHTPLTRDGEHKTLHLVDAQRLASMKPNACLINASRGEVVDNAALLAHLKAHQNFTAVLDVWENEPTPDSELMRHCLIATPHIAGYSLDGKLNGTSMVYQKACDYFGLPKRRKLAQLTPQAPLRKISFSVEADAQFAVAKTIRSMYDVRDDHFRMMGLASMAEGEKAKSFDALRKDYPLRRDLNCLNVSLPNSALEQDLEPLNVKIRQR